MATKASKAMTPGPLRVDLGRVDMCLSVRSIARSRTFYRKLGFREIGGRYEEKWLILKRGDFRLGLYQGHIGENVMNFRGGHVGRIVAGLQERGLKPYHVRGLQPNGRGSAMVDDPDGNILFFDSSSQERAARRRARLRR
jgi:catechol 2,3-dioxygenase-like lactoylglutathione lyase family enzyme